MTEGIYDLHINIRRVPLLGWEPDLYMNKLKVSEVMHRPVYTFETVEQVNFRAFLWTLCAFAS